MAAESGTGTGGSFRMLTQQAEYDKQFNTGILEQNYQDAVLRIRSDADAGHLNLQQNLASNIAQLNMQRQNPILAGFQGLIGGVQTGLSIATGIRFLNEPVR